MASYSSSPTQFNPYVSQLPLVQEIQQVEQEKQGQYNQGVQKIQTQIDNVAGLSVMRDVDKNYLQSQMNQLGNNLKTVAAGDFSNYQLTNSVGGMVNQVGKDENIQNAVYSTARVRKAMADKDQAVKAGKSSPENEWDLSGQIGSYLNNPELKASFNGEYTPYTDVSKKMFDIYSKLKSQDSDIEDPYQKDSNGNYIEDKDGHKVMSPIMVETILKGNSSSQIANAIRASLDENDLRQISITGRYAYRGVTNDQLKADTFNTYTQRKQVIQDRITQLQQQSILQSKNPQAVADYNKTINQLKSDIAPGNYYDQQLSQAFQSIDNNPEAVKAQLYKDKSIMAFADANANETKAIKFLENPEEKVREWGLDYAQRNVFHTDDINLGRDKYNLDVKKEDFNEKTWFLKNSNNNPTNPGGLKPHDMDYFATVQNDVTKYQTQYNGYNNQLRDALVDELKNTSGFSDPTGEKVKAFRDKLTNDYLKNITTAQYIPVDAYKVSLPPRFQDTLDARAEAYHNILKSTNKLNTANDAATNDPELKTMIATLPPIRVDVPGEGTKIMQPGDVQTTIANIRTKLDNAPGLAGTLNSINKALGPGIKNDFFNIISNTLYKNVGGDITKGVIKDLAGVGSNMFSKLIGKDKPFATEEDIDKWFNSMKYVLTPTELQVYNQMNQSEDDRLKVFPSGKYGDLESHLKVHDEFIKKRDAVLATLYSNYVPKWKDIDNRLISKETLRTTASNILSNAAMTDTGSAFYKKSDAESLLKNKAEDLNFTVYRNHDQPFLSISKVGSSDSQMIPISEELATNYGLPRNLDEDFLSDIKGNGGTTNTMKGSPEGAYIKRSTDKYNIAIDYKPSGINDNKLYPYLMIQKDGRWETYKLKNSVDLQRAREAIGTNYSNEAIEQTLKNNNIKM